MRVDARNPRPPRGRSYRIFLDGQSAGLVVWADDEAGELERIVKGDDGRPVIVNGAAKTEVVRGRVQIVPLAKYGSATLEHLPTFFELLNEAHEVSAAVDAFDLDGGGPDQKAEFAKLLYEQRDAAVKLVEFVLANGGQVSAALAELGRA